MSQLKTKYIQDGAVTEPKLANASVSAGKLQTNSVTNSKIANDAVSNLKIADDAVDSRTLANDAVQTANILNDAVTGPKILIELGGSLRGTDGITPYAMLTNLSNTTMRAGLVLDMNNKKITNLALPTVAQDGASKEYVDSIALGLSVKRSSRAATTTDISISSAPASLDGVVLNSGDSVLVKDQVNPIQNGVYIFNGTGNPLTRRFDYDPANPNAAKAGAFTFVTEGTIHADTGWSIVTDDPFVIGTNPINFSQTASTQAGNVVTPGPGLIDLGGGNFAVNVDNATTKILADQVVGLTPIAEQVTLTLTDVTNGYIDLANRSAFDASIFVIPEGGIVQLETSDYTPSIFGLVTRVTFNGAFLSNLAAGDLIQFRYMKL